MAVLVSIPHHALSTMNFQRIATSVKCITQRVFSLTLKYFGLLQSVGVLGFGLQEIGLGYLPVKWGWNVKAETSSGSQKIQNQQQVKNIQGIQAEQSGVHGLFYLGSGALCTLGEMEAASWLKLGGLGPDLIQSGWTLFLFANLFSLDQNLKLYNEADKLGGTLGHRLKVSAILGMINNLGYVIGTLCSFFQGTMAIGIILAILAIMAGTVKFFYDFFFVSLPQ